MSYRSTLSFKTPFEILRAPVVHQPRFKKLRMWPEAVECLICAERNVEAEDMVKAGWLRGLRTGA